MVRIPIVSVDSGQPLPTYAKPGDAGLDLRAREGAVLKAGGGRASVRCGIRLAIPEGYAGFVLPRSGLARDHGITCVNSPGLVDSGYRGEIVVVLVNTDPSEDFVVEPGERIAQLVVQRVEHVEFDVVDELDETERGEGGFGHTGR
jgi:dUTP pyrophosphatase